MAAAAGAVCEDGSPESGGHHHGRAPLWEGAGRPSTSEGRSGQGSVGRAGGQAGNCSWLSSDGFLSRPCRELVPLGNVLGLNLPVLLITV